MSNEEIKNIVTAEIPNKIKNKILFDKIKLLQSLPEEIIYDFLNCKGVLRTTNYKSKLLLHAKQD